MERIGIIEADAVVNVVKAPADWVDPQGREVVRGPDLQIGAVRQPDGSFAAPSRPAPTLEEARAYAHRCLRNWVERFLQRFTDGVPSAEIASWPAKAERARSYLAGSPSQMIETEAHLRGVTPKQMAEQIVAKSDAYETIIAAVSGLRSTTQSAIAAAETPEEIDAVIKNAMTIAEAMKAQMGLSDA